MAVKNAYVNADTEAGKLALNVFVCGEKPLFLTNTFQVLAADDAASVYRLFPSIPSNYRVIKLEVLNDVIAGASDVDFGVYAENHGAVILNDADVSLKDIFGDGLTLATTHEVDAPLQGTANVTIADASKSIEELITTTYEKTKSPSAVDICMTLNTNPTATGYVTVRAHFQPQGD